MLQHILRVSLFLSVAVTVGGAQAAMRCNNGIISEGHTTWEVTEKCGEPQDRERIEPTVGSNGKPPRHSATIENWVYGPDNGMYRHLRFIDGKLVEIESRRL